MRITMTLRHDLRLQTKYLCIKHFYAHLNEVHLQSKRKKHRKLITYLSIEHCSQTKP